MIELLIILGEWSALVIVLIFLSAGLLKLIKGVLYLLSAEL